MPHAVMPVQQGGRLGLFDHLDLGPGAVHPGLDPVVVVLEPAHAVRLDPPQVRLDQHVGADAGLLLWRSQRGEHVYHERVDGFDGNRCLLPHLLKAPQSPLPPPPAWGAAAVAPA